MSFSVWVYIHVCVEVPLSKTCIALRSARYSLPHQCSSAIDLSQTLWLCLLLVFFRYQRLSLLPFGFSSDLSASLAALLSGHFRLPPSYVFSHRLAAPSASTRNRIDKGILKMVTPRAATTTTTLRCLNRQRRRKTKVVLMASFSRADPYFNNRRTSRI